MKTKGWAVIFVIISTIFTTIGQYFWKLGSMNLSIDTIYTNYWLLIGFFFYGISAGLLIVALKGGDLSVLYPIIATSFIWVTIISYYQFGDGVGIYKWLGVGAIIIGITYIGVGSKC